MFMNDTLPYFDIWIIMTSYSKFESALSSERISEVLVLFSLQIFEKIH